MEKRTDCIIMGPVHYLIDVSQVPQNVMDLDSLECGLHLHGGGAALDSALCFLKTGFMVSVVSAVGDDDFGREIVKTMADAGADTRYVSIRGETPLRYTLFGNDGMAHRLVPSSIVEKDLPDVPGDFCADWLHISGEYRRQNLAAICAKAKAAGMTVSLEPDTDDLDVFTDALPFCDVLVYDGTQKFPELRDVIRILSPKQFYKVETLRGIAQSCRERN